MRIRIDGTHAELVHTVNKLRTILPVGSVSPIRRRRRPYTWRVFIDTAPNRDTGRWIA
ncbi:hypothetical protein FHS43_003725 [Streptosporangium becharense]|uniref:Uncharacterized protein n=1 Tax=Streptosporangium becharense TaxID=1816182 RepID=A0A7W9IH97_9ACTN|nr:hypothetical protein [Streptosporangium becharense]MBB2912442.1 hypothetical protein [Streptosporangium becharense]MBB5820729.1 hypothetical protein [Streptosporangium becharense]